MLAKAGPSCLKPESEKSFADRSSRIRQALSAICAANPAAPWSPRPLAPHTHVARGGIGVRREPLPPLSSAVPDSSAVWRSAEGERPAVELARSWPKAAPASGPRALDDTSKYVSEWLRRRPSQSRRKRSTPIPLPAMSRCWSVSFTCGCGFSSVSGCLSRAKPHSEHHLGNLRARAVIATTIETAGCR